MMDEDILWHLVCTSSVSLMSSLSSMLSQRSIFSKRLAKRGYGLLDIEGNIELPIRDLSIFLAVLELPLSRQNIHVE
jgi:hypothetical protein